MLYIDDILIACKEKTKIEALKKILSIVFHTEDLGTVKRILGVKIIRNRSKGPFSFSFFYMLDYKLVQVPLAF